MYISQFQNIAAHLASYYPSDILLGYVWTFQRNVLVTKELNFTKSRHTSHKRGIKTDEERTV